MFCNTHIKIMLFLNHTAPLSYFLHYSAVIMGAMASQITSLTIVSINLYSAAYKKKTSKFRVTGDRWIPRTDAQ